MADKNPKFPGEKFRAFFDQELARSEQGVSDRPDDPAAQAAYAESLINLWCYGFISRDELLPKAKLAARKAVQLDESYSGAHMVEGIIKMTDWDWAGAEKELRQAIKLDQDQYKSRHWYALYLSAMQRHEEAIKESKISVSLLTPSDSMIGYGSILYFAHEFEEMAKVLEQAVIDEPDFASVYDWLGMAYVQLEEFDKSINVYEKAVDLSDGLAEIKSGLGHAYGLAGKTTEARQILDEMLTLSKVYYVPPVQIAFVALSLGDTDLTFELLERAFAERSWELVFINTEPWFDILHDDRRFQDFIRGLNFPK